MNKFCGKCGLQMTDDDFLCPNCGAIWGDRVYHVPKPPASASDCEDLDANEFNEPAAQNEQPKLSEQRKLPRWLLPLAAVCVVLACVLFVMGSDWMPWAGEGSTVPFTDTAAPETNSTAPTEPNLPYTVYTVKFVDPYGTPIAGVDIENPWNYKYSAGLLGSSGTLHSDAIILPAYNLTSDENGNASFILFHSSKGDVCVNILSIPQGYDQSMVGQTKYFAEGQTQMLIVLKFSDEPPLEIDPTVPPGGDEENTVYTLWFVDPDGNPVPGVKIFNPIRLSSSRYLESDSNGMIEFSAFYGIDAVVIAGVPEGYSKDLVDVPQYFKGSTRMKFVLDFEKDTEIDIPDIPTYAYYPITMDGDMWLYEPLQSVYLAGQTVRVKITYDNRKSCMLFANGVEITDCTLVDDQYWEFVFKMPEDAVELKLRLFYSDHLDEAAETMIREYYRQIPDAKEVHLMNYYGQYGDAIVGMLNHYDTNTDAVHYEVVADYTFVYTTQNMIVVLVNGKFVSLLEAYMVGHLTEADVAEIYRIHLMGNQE